jgi:hypothetical protein
MVTKKKKAGTFPVSVNGKQFAAALAAVAKAAQQLANVPPPMDSAERKHVVKLRVGTSLVVPTIGTLVEKYGLQTDHVSMDGSSSLLAYAKSLRDLLSPVEELQQTIKDEILRSEANAWTGLSVSYGMLQNVAIAVPALAKELAGVEAWFRRGHTSGKPAAAAEEPAATPAAAENPAPKA